MIAKIYPSKLNGKISAIPSKSYAHRLLILAMLSENDTEVLGLYPSKDITATLNCVKALGCNVENNIVSKADFKSKATLDVNESGSSLRFLLPVAASVGGDFNFVGAKSLFARPNTELFKVMREKGVEIKDSDLGISISGKLESGRYEISGDVSSQYITGLLMALPRLDGDSEIVLTTKLSSKGYVDITIECLKLFGVEIKERENGYFIKGNQKYLAKKVETEGDYSNASYFLGYSALKGGVFVDNLKSDSSQGDRDFLEVLRNMGFILENKGKSIGFQGNIVGNCVVDVDNIIDLAPTLAVVLSQCKGKSVLANIKRLRIKESNRVEAIVSMLKGVGIQATATENSIEIIGGEVIGGVVDSFNDHRIVMASTILGLISKNGVTIKNAEAVEKSYPTFFFDIEKLGGVVNVQI